MNIRSTKPYFDLPFGWLCGLILDEPTMKKVAKLFYKQNQELKELLQANIDGVEVSNWTLAYPNGNQESIYYVSDECPWETKEGRIGLVDRMNQVSRIKHLYFGKREDAHNEHMRLYDNETEVELPKATESRKEETV